MSSAPSLSLDLAHDVRELLTYQFMQNALAAGTIVAVLAAVVGWYMVVRRLSFAGHTLAVMAFPGAAAASLAGLPASLGYYLGSGAAAIAMGRTGSPPSRGDGGQSAAIGTIQAVGLAIGFLLLSLNHGVLTDLESLLFGSIYGVSGGQVVTLMVVAAVVLCGVGLASRPLLFASVDPEVARSRGVPVALVDLLFLVALAVTVAATSQITGVLLVFSLLVAPAAAAQALTPRPVVGLALSVLFAVLVVWVGLGVSYFSIYKPGFFVTTLAFGLYVVARMYTRARGRRR
jgi:zinc/manganese transport system permease protein